MKIITPHTRKDAKRNWFSLYECDCGKHFETRDFMVRSGRTRSCGCLKDSITSARFSVMNHKHGMTRTPTWSSWNAMIRRCRYPSMRHWEHYGGRGITVCDRWKVFANFLSDMGERPSGCQLGRLDNDGNYEPTNCAWQTASENQGEKNRRVKPWEFTSHVRKSRQSRAHQISE